MTVTDTDVLIDFLTNKSDGKVEDFLRRGALMTTVITRYELVSGAKTPKQMNRLLQLLEAIPALDLDSQAADLASEIRKVLERLGSPIGMADSLIAGIVKSNGGTLLTRNRRHFERVEGLKLS